MGDENPIRTLGDYSKPSHEGYRNTIELPVGNNMVPLRSDTIRLVQNGCSFHGLRSEDPNQHLKDFLKLVDSLDLDGENRERTRLRLFQFSLRDQASNWLERLPAGSITTWEDLTTRFLAQFFPPGRTAKLCNDILIRTIDQSAGGKLRDRNAKKSWALLEDLALYDNESWNDLRDFAKPVKAVALPQDVSSTSDRRLIELENQVQRLMEAHLALTQPTQVNKITTSCEICSGPHDTQYCMEDPEQAFVEYASSRTDEAGDLKEVDSSFCTHKILMEDEFKPSVQPQRRVNPNIKEVVKKEVIKLLDAGLIYPISDSPWVSPVQVVLKKGGMTIVKNEKDELIPQRTITRWRGNDLLMGTHGSNLYTIALQESSSLTPICFMAKASPTQAWLWDCRLFHLNFDTINLLSKNDIVNGLPKLKYTWTHFLRSKDETPEVLIDFLKMIQHGLQAQVINVRTNRGTEFLNKTLQTYFKEGISHQTIIARTLKQNDVVERRNRTLVEAARTMLLASKLPLLFWDEAIATVCYT
ncbi:MAK10-like protein [Tanacetum coccineum]